MSPLLNAELPLFVYFPPSRDLFRDTGRLLGQREGGETDRDRGPVARHPDTTGPLIDATIK